jgi:copper resistance protein D
MGLVVARVVHVLSATVWVGGTVFLVAVAVPYARSLGPDKRTEIASAIGRRFRPVAWTAMAGLVASGLYMLQKLGYLEPDALSGTSGGRLMMAKLGAVAVLIVLSAVHDFVLGPRTERRPETRSTLLVLARASGVLTLIVPVLGVLLAH